MINDMSSAMRLVREWRVATRDSDEGESLETRGIAGIASRRPAKGGLLLPRVRSLPTRDSDERAPRHPQGPHVCACVRVGVLVGVLVGVRVTARAQRAHMCKCVRAC